MEIVSIINKAQSCLDEAEQLNLTNLSDSEIDALMKSLQNITGTAFRFIFKVSLEKSRRKNR